MGKSINISLITGRDKWRTLFLPLVADVCCAHDYLSVCELMNEHYSSADAKQRRELADVLVSISESWNRGRLAKGGEIILKDEFSDVPRVQPVSDEQRELENRLPLNAKQVEWLQRWADEPQPVDEAPEPVGGGVASGADHYSLDWDKEQLQTIYERLIDNGYIAQETTFGQWQYVCTGRGGNEPHTAIMWLKTQSELAYLCKRLFCPTQTFVWQTACNVFRWIKGKPLNVQTMKSELDHKLQTKKWDLMKELLFV